MVKGDEDVAMDILEHVVWGGLFNNRRCEVALRLAIIACAIRTKAWDKIAENSKRLAQLHQFRPEPMLLMLSAFGAGQKQQLAWHNVTLQKFLHRELRIYDEAVLGVKLRWNKIHQRWAQIIQAGVNRRVIDTTADVDESVRMFRTGSNQDDNGNESDEEEVDDGVDEDEGDVEGDRDIVMDAAMEDEAHPKPHIQSPVFNTMYGQNMLTTKSYQSALCTYQPYRTNRSLPLPSVRSQPV